MLPFFTPVLVELDKTSLSQIFLEFFREYNLAALFCQARELLFRRLL
jgi:hypothetical protein